MRAWNRPDEYQYDYVQDADPTTETTVEEGQTWYDTGAGAAFVYDGAAWVEMTVSDHSQLTGVSADTHHVRYTDSEAAAAAPVKDVNGQTGSVSLQGIPSGVITMWSGTTSDIPSGWTLCDGTDGTPDLRDRFIAGAGNQYSAGDTGGQDSVQLSVSELPSHSHSYTRYPHFNSGSDALDGGGTEGGTAEQTDDTGGDQAHENRPPFYALAFIQKV